MWILDALLRITLFVVIGAVSIFVAFNVRTFAVAYGADELTSIKAQWYWIGSYQTFLYWLLIHPLFAKNAKKSDCSTPESAASVLEPHP